MKRVLFCLFFVLVFGCDEGLDLNSDTMDSSPDSGTKKIVENSAALRGSGVSAVSSKSQGLSKFKIVDIDSSSLTNSSISQTETADNDIDFSKAANTNSFLTENIADKFPELDVYNNFDAFSACSCNTFNDYTYFNKEVNFKYTPPSGGIFETYINGNIIFSTGPTGNWVQYSDTGASLYLFADINNKTGNEDSNPEILLEQDGGIVKAKLRIEGSADGNYLANSTILETVTDYPLQIGQNSQAVITIDNNQNVGIGEKAPENKLDVNGTIKAKEILVSLSGWSDYVFDDEYNLMDLNEVDSFISKNGHLPNVPSEKEVKENGISVGKSDAKLLEKIEELTLYLIDQNKKLENQAEEIKNLKRLVKDSGIAPHGGRHD